MKLTTTWFFVVIFRADAQLLLINLSAAKIATPFLGPLIH